MSLGVHNLENTVVKYSGVVVLKRQYVKKFKRYQSNAQYIEGELNKKTQS